MLPTLVLIILPFQYNQGKFQPQINLSISSEPKHYPERNLPTLTDGCFYIFMVFNINWMLAILLCLIFSPLYIVDISKFSILIKRFFTPYTSNFIFSWCVCIMFIEKSWALRWKFEQLPPTNLQMESAPLYCFPTSAWKEWSFYLLFIPNPSSLSQSWLIPFYNLWELTLSATSSFSYT